MKQLQGLINTDEPGWDLVKEWLNQAINPYEILPADKERAERELVLTQVTTRSPMGALIYETGGILIDSGWIRILGSGSERLDRGLMEWNKGKSFKEPGDTPGFMLVADDVIGGYFAINAGALGHENGHVYYLPQDTLEWESLGRGYSDFIRWALNGNLEQFYGLFRWKNWKTDVGNINGNQTFSFFPFLWTKYEDFEQVSRKAVPVEENYQLTMEMKKQLADR